MSIGLITGILIGGVFIMLASGIYIGLALGGIGIFGLEFLADMGKLSGAILYNSIDSFLLSAIPLFLFMGEIVQTSGLGNRLYTGVSRWVRIIPGGLIQANIISCAIFAAISGAFYR